MNKFLIPVALAATVVIAGIFAFMPVEKASTVHGTLSTATGLTDARDNINSNTDSELDALDRGISFSLNMSRDGTKGIFTLVPAKVGKTLSGHYILSATPNNHTKVGGGGAVTTFECGLVDGQGNVLSATNASAPGGTPANGTLAPTAGRAIAVQIDRTSSNVGGVCSGVIFLDSDSGE